MTPREKEFESAIAVTLEALKELILIKGKEYRRNNNPYHNFERGAEMTDLTREEILQGFLRKHLISVEDMRNDTKRGIYPDEEKVNEKYNDILIYFLIEKAMMLESSWVNAPPLKSKGALDNISISDVLPNLSKEAEARIREGNLNDIFSKNA